MDPRAERMATVLIQQYGHEEEFAVFLDDDDLMSRIAKALERGHNCLVNIHPIKPLLTIRPQTH